MSASAVFPLRYVLPTTALSVHATLRLVVVVDTLGGHLEPEVDVSLAAPWHPEPLTSVRRVLRGDGDPLNGSLPASAVPGSLRKAFDRSHPRTAALIADLSARCEQYLAGLRMGEEPALVVTFGQALTIVHRELAGADRTRREWISRQGRRVRTVDCDVTGADMITIPAKAARLPGDTELPDGRAQDLARDYGLLVALVDGTGADTRTRSRSVEAAVYRRTPGSWPGQAAVADPDEEWVRDDALSRLWLTDGSDPTNPVGDLPAPRQSPQGQQVLAPLPGRTSWVDPDVEAMARAARTQLDLIDASDEYSRLASAQHRADEIASLQHQMRIAYLPRQRQGD